MLFTSLSFGCYHPVMMSESMCAWQSLLSPLRLRDAREQRGLSPSSSDRSAFNQDYGRVLYSSAFRRLQDKTQVFPLGRNDYVRTRLTHSLEVANVGRSLGQSLAHLLRGKHADEVEGMPQLVEEVGDMVATACLAHDMGNPPFGHSGEKALEKASKGTPFSDEPFEGNAQGFRLLARTCDPMYGCGLNLTVATLGAFSKYPCTPEWKKKSSYIGMKKYGVYDVDKERFNAVAAACGLAPLENGAWRRHPLSYLMEAADDISYIIADVEDAYISGIISYDEARANLEMLAGKADKLAEVEAEGGKRSAIRYLRAMAVGNSMKAVREVMDARLPELRDGLLGSSLVDLGYLKDIHRQVADFSYKYIYQHESVIRVEVTGYEIIAKLHDLFMNWVDEPSSDLGRKLARLMHAPEKMEGEELAKDRFFFMRDYIAGMTDSFAQQSYRSLYGLA